MRQRVIKLYAGLIAELTAKAAPDRAAKWRGEQLRARTFDEMIAAWKDKPVQLSPELQSKSHQMTLETAPDEEAYT
jgi:hypothetical protein